MILLISNKIAKTGGIYEQEIRYLGVMFIIMSHATVLSPSSVSAATQFTSDYFGIGFDQHEVDKMEKADGWSNGGMFDCTWTASNVNFPMEL